jgi:hypothetical protein
MISPQAEEGSGLLSALAQMDEASLDLDNAMAEAVDRCQRVGKKATVSLTLEFSLSKEGRVVVTHAVKTKLPEFPRVGKLFYVTDKNGLSVDDPHQAMLPEMSGEAARFAHKASK